MRGRGLQILVGFLASATLVLVALSWITRSALRLERTEWEALNRSILEEDVRLALWRLDGALAGFLARENARSVEEFMAAPERGDPGSEPSGAPGEAGFVRGRFVSLQGSLLQVIPRDALAGWRRLENGADEEASEDREPRESSSPEGEEGQRALPPIKRDPWEVLRNTPGVLVDRIQVGGNESGRQGSVIQEQLNIAEYQQRQQLLEPPAGLPEVEPATVTAPFTASWREGMLILDRRVRAYGGERGQTIWLDWPPLESWLLEQIQEVFPQAGLIPIEDEATAADPGRRLALLPVRLDPGTVAADAPPPWSPIRITLSLAWVAAVVALAGLGWLLWGSQRLSQRRADFVSAVTHELRTPLTTFQLHTDMLAEDMVPSEERPAFARRLRREAVRLGHLVENVLGFSRLEKGSWAPPPPTPIGDLLEAVWALLTERAEQGGLELSLELPEELARVQVPFDRERLERILFNLVDNACKYAGGSEPAVIEMVVERRRRSLVLRLRDHGPGIPRSERRRLFQPFHKSAEHAAEQAPGVGLGLALARRLARSLGGDLRWADVSRGAAFDLFLPIVHGGAGHAPPRPTP